jgi:hypothetical protein
LAAVLARDHSFGMHSRQLALASVLALVTLMLPGCATTTVERVWQAPEWTGSFDHVVIFGVSQPLLLNTVRPWLKVGVIGPRISRPRVMRVTL